MSVPVTTSQVEDRRALLLPQEIKELPADDELIFFEGCKLIRARKNWFFKDKAFKQQAGLPPVEVVAAPAIPGRGRRATKVSRSRDRIGRDGLRRKPTTA